MFNNIGRKIKAVAATITWIGIGISVLVGFTTMLSSSRMVLTGILIILIGSLVSWLSSLTLYGFGQLIENSDILVAQTKQNSYNYNYFEMENNADKSKQQSEANHK